MSNNRNTVDINEEVENTSKNRIIEMSNNRNTVDINAEVENTSKNRIIEILLILMRKWKMPPKIE